MYIDVMYMIKTQSKCTKRWKQKQLLETLFLAIKMCTDTLTFKKSHFKKIANIHHNILKANKNV